MRSSLFVTTAAALIGLAAIAAEAAPAMTRADFSGMSNIQLAQAGKQTTVRVKSAILRAGPSTSSKKMASLRRGTKVQVLGQADQWTKVRAGNQEGYISSSLLNQ